MKIDKKIIKELNEYLEEFNLTEIEITEKDTKIKVSKNISANISQPPIVAYNSQSKKSTSDNNQSINANYIICNADPHKVYEDLLDENKNSSFLFKWKKK